MGFFSFVMFSGFVCSKEICRISAFGFNLCCFSSMFLVLMMRRSPKYPFFWFDTSNVGVNFEKSCDGLNNDMISNQA